MPVFICCWIRIRFIIYIVVTSIRSIPIICQLPPQTPQENHLHDQALRSGIRCLLLNLLLGAFVFLDTFPHRSCDAILGARMGLAARMSLPVKLALPASLALASSSECSARFSCDSLARNLVSVLPVDVGFLVMTRRDSCTPPSLSALDGSRPKLRCLSLKMRRRKRDIAKSTRNTICMYRLDYGSECRDSRFWRKEDGFTAPF